jgi:tight adherence protein B
VIETITERTALRRLVTTLTAQGRLGGIVVSAMPLAVLLIISATNPEYLDPLVSTTTGKLLLAAGGVMVALGWTAIRKIVDIKL